MKTIIGIFRGKQAKYNKMLLETLYDNGPLSAWELVGKLYSPSNKELDFKGKISLHATFNKRLRSLEGNGYTKRVKKKWVLQFKGIIAVLIIQPDPKPWSEKWTKIFENYVKPLKNTSKKYAITENGMEIADLTEIAKHSPVIVREFERWVVLANEVKKLMEKGFINLDVIKNETLLMLILTELLLDFPKKEV